MSNKEKTLSDLNKTVWYRLLKVAYFTFFGLATVGWVIWAVAIISSNELKGIDNSKTTITCLNLGSQNVGKYTVRTESLNPSEINVQLQAEYFPNGKFDYAKYFRGYNEFAIKDILKTCYDPKDQRNIDTQDIYAIQRGYEITGVPGAEKQYDQNKLDEEIKNITSGYKTNEAKANYLDFSVKLFDITPKYTYWNDNTIGLLIYIGLVIVFFEGGRRIFYYIVLGTARPKK